MISSEDNGVSDKSENISAAGTETVNTGSDPNLVIAELKKLHLKEINELRVSQILFLMKLCIFRLEIKGFFFLNEEST